MTRPDLETVFETVFETKMISSQSRDHFETNMSHYLEWRDWSRDQNGLDSGIEKLVMG